MRGIRNRTLHEAFIRKLVCHDLSVVSKPVLARVTRASCNEVKRPSQSYRSGNLQRCPWSRNSKTFPAALMPQIRSQQMCDARLDI